MNDIIHEFLKQPLHILLFNIKFLSPLQVLAQYFDKLVKNYETYN